MREFVEQKKVKLLGYSQRTETETLDKTRSNSRLLPFNRLAGSLLNASRDTEARRVNLRRGGEGRENWKDG